MSLQFPTSPRPRATPESPVTAQRLREACALAVRPAPETVVRVTVTVPGPLGEWVSDLHATLGRRSHDAAWHAEGTDDTWVLASGPLALTAHELGLLRRAPRDCGLPGATVEVTDLSPEYVLWQTSAPVAYDYPGTCLDLEPMRPNGTRRVAVQQARASYQYGRYASGMHTPTGPCGERIDGQTGYAAVPR